ncbi:MAG TPA: fimbrillin family protein [Candidatus Coprenecus stercoravium]|uniref:Fimbrillin family protein n=1 Tax=Candidatus Coprenecus stercoravium TaxID=2840735 RepID=A0A9D2GQL0_9BACT|nr:fimbrillin family protein [Candidatus Coprenecus stercoravium]
MKKVLLAALAGVVVLAGCAKTEVVETSDSASIRFDNAFVGNPTKATVNQVATDQFDNFYVLAYTTDNANFFSNEKVYLKNGVYVYDDLKQWKQNAGYAFAAYSNGGYNAATDGVLTGVTFASDELQIADYTVKNDDKRDLVVSISDTDLETTNEPVAFTFDHALAMIKFTLNNGVGDNDIQITGFTVKQVPNTATMTLNAEGIKWGATSANTDFTSADFTSTQETAGESDEFVVIPVTDGVNLEIAFTATVTKTDGTQITNDLKSTIATYTWQPGYRYNYVATITGTDLEVIEFAAPVVTTWEDFTNPNAGNPDPEIPLEDAQ